MTHDSWHWWSFTHDSDSFMHAKGSSWLMSHESWLMTHDSWLMTHDPWLISMVIVYSWLLTRLCTRKAAIKHRGHTTVYNHMTYHWRVMSRDEWPMTHDSLHSRLFSHDSRLFYARWRQQQKKGLHSHDLWLMTHDEWPMTRCVGDSVLPILTYLFMR